jgi:hypothetical protein
MNRAPDDGLRALFHKHLPYPRDLQDVEVGMRDCGVPDLNGCIDGMEFWIEMKATSGWTIDLKPAQIGWLVTRARHGGRVFVAVRRRTSAGPRRGSAADELWLLNGSYARELRTSGLRKAPRPAVLGTWSGGPRAWDWGVVQCLLAAT